MRARRPGRGAGQLVRVTGERPGRGAARRCRRRGRPCCRAGRRSALARGAPRSSSASRATRPIAPDDPLRALALVAPDAVKVVVIGQDPYPTAGHADGLAFSAGQGGPARWRGIFERAGRRPAGLRAARRLAARRLGAAGRAAAESGADGRGRRAAAAMLDCGWQALTDARSSKYLSRSRRRRPCFCFGVRRRQRDSSAPRDPAGTARCALTTRHPSYDFEPTASWPSGNHFAATAATSSTGGRSVQATRCARAIVPGSSRRGARVAKGGRL